MTETIFAGKMPILALRGLCVFPEQTVHFEVGRSKSVKALEAAMQGDQTLLLIPQKDLLVDDPTLKDLYPVGCIAKVKQVLKTQGENLRILVTGISRGKITELSQSEPYLSGIVESASVEEPADTIRARALRREANSLYGVYLEPRPFSFGCWPARAAASLPTLSPRIPALTSRTRRKCSAS